MTEALKQWVYSKADLAPGDYEQAHALSRKAAEFWISTFCAEVEKRTMAHYDAPAWSPAYRKTMSACKGIAFTELTRELLGDPTQ